MYDHAGDEVSPEYVLDDEELADYYAQHPRPVAPAPWRPFLPPAGVAS